MSKPSLSIVIPVFKQPEWIGRTIADPASVGYLRINYVSSLLERGRREEATALLAAELRLASPVEQAAEELIARSQLGLSPDLRALQMAEELVTEPGPFGRPFDEAGNIGHHEAAMLAAIHYAQIRIEGGEGIVGHFGFGGRERTNQR